MTSNLYHAIREHIKGRFVEKRKKQETETTKQPIGPIQQTQYLEETSGILIGLENEHEIKFIKKESVKSIKEYIFSSIALWYWVTVLLAIAAAVSIFAIPENAVPLVYLRTGLGLFFILFLPGFVFIKTLFPVKMPFKTSSENMDIFERVGLSLGMSLTLTPMVGLVLNYTPWGVRLVSITLSLLALTVVLATFAVFRDLKQDKPKQNGEDTIKQDVSDLI